MQRLEKLINYKFKNKKLLEQSLTHPSYSKGNSFERLEFLGDLILDAIVGIYLYKKYSNETESFLTDLKAAYVNKRYLTEVAKKLNIKSFIRYRGCEIRRVDRFVEALIGAMYLDGGWRNAEKFVKKFILDKEIEPLKDYKNILQKISQRLKGTDPVYTLVKETGPPHDKEYEVKVKIPGIRKIGKGKGKTKKEAQLLAAKNILTRLNLHI